MSEPERLTASGIALPEPEGHPVCQLATDVPGLAINIVIPEGQDRLEYVERLAQEITALARDPYRDPLDLADPHFGDPCYLTPLGAQHVVTVGHARAQKVDPQAASNHRRILQARRPIVRPG